MTLIGVLSDTHGRLDPRAYAALVECDRIIHAGDICDPSILRELQTIGPVDAVLGNNDLPSRSSTAFDSWWLIILMMCESVSREARRLRRAILSRTCAFTVIRIFHA